MDNHFHLLLEVPPMAEGGLSDEELLKRLSAIYGEAFVAGVAMELAGARSAVYTNGIIHSRRIDHIVGGHSVEADAVEASVGIDGKRMNRL